MANDIENLNLYQKLAKIRKLVSVLQKNKAGFGYKYVTEDEILSKVTYGMEKYNVSLIPSICPQTLQIEQYKYQREDKKEKDENKRIKDVYEILLKADMEFKWINDENPEEFLIVPWIMTGQQADASMAFGSSLSYTNRYFLLKYFQVSTVDDDPDNWRSKQKLMGQEEELSKLKEIHEAILKSATEQIEKGINKEIVYKVIADNNDNKKNPNSIKDINIANKVLEEIKNLKITK